MILIFINYSEFGIDIPPRLSWDVKSHCSPVFSRWRLSLKLDVTMLVVARGVEGRDFSMTGHQTCRLLPRSAVTTNVTMRPASTHLCKEGHHHRVQQHERTGGLLKLPSSFDLLLRLTKLDRNFSQCVAESNLFLLVRTKTLYSLRVLRRA